MIDSYEKNSLIIEEHDKRINTCETDIKALEDRVSSQTTQIMEIKTEIKNLCKSVDNLAGTVKTLCTISVTFLLVFFVYMLQNHFVIK